MNLVCKGATSFGSNEAVERARGSSKEDEIELIIFPEGGVEGREADVDLRDWT